MPASSRPPGAGLRNDLAVARRHFTAILPRVSGPNLEHEFEARFGWLVNPYGKDIAKKLAAFATKPDTAMRALQRRLETRLDTRRAKVGDAGIVADLTLSWMPAQTLRDGLQDLPQRLAEDRGAFNAHAFDREFAQLVERAESRVPGGAMLVLPPPCRHGRGVMHIAARLDALSHLRGEQRAREALATFGIAFEELYAPWILRLWILCDLANAAPSTPPGMIGAVAGRITGMVNSELLLDDAVHLRNAAFHSKAEYCPSTRALMLHDREWAVTWRSDEIEVRVAAVLEIQACLGKVLAWSAIRAMHESGTMSATVEHLLALRNSMECDPSSLKAAERKLFGPIGLFLASSSGEYEALRQLRVLERPFFG